MKATERLRAADRPPIRGTWSFFPIRTTAAMKHAFPPAAIWYFGIRNAVYQSPDLYSEIILPKSRKNITALLVVLFLFAWMAHKAGAETFVQGLLAAYGYMVVLAVFDTCFLDWILFANIKRIRLPGTEHMEKEYHQKWFHVKVMLPLLPVFAVGGVAIAFLMTWIW